MNPFDYQSPSRPPRLIDRRDELDALQRAAANRLAVRLAAPRRFGKTSLLDAHIAAMRGAGHRAVRVDFSQTTSVADAAGRLARAYSELPDPDGIVTRWRRQLDVQVSLGPVTLGTRGAEAAADGPRYALLELLDVPRRLHMRDGGLTVVCFDEFQDLLTAYDRIDGLFRSVIQHHQDAAAYVFAGSKPSMMRALFGEYERPFYGQASPLDLPPLPYDETFADTSAAFTTAGLDPGEVLTDLVHRAAGHPQRIALFCYWLFEALDTGERPSAETVVERALALVDDSLSIAWDGLGNPERQVLAALARGLAPTGTIVSREHATSRSSLQRALERLLDDGRHVVRRDGRPVLLDPLLAEWLRRR